MKCQLDKRKRLIDDYLDSKMADLRNTDKGPDETFNMTFAEMLDELQMSEEQYVLAIRRGVKGTEVMLKREPADIRTNQYNRSLLDVWQANIDVSFIIDPYSCAQYIVNYISKDDRGMSTTLRNAVKETRARNESLKQQFRYVYWLQVVKITTVCGCLVGYCRLLCDGLL